MFMKKRILKLGYHLRMFCNSVIEIFAGVLQKEYQIPYNTMNAVCL